MKNILAILVALLQLLLSDVIIQIVFGSSLLWETSGSAGSDIILFVIEAYMGGLFLLTNLFILYESKIISTILILWLWGAAYAYRIKRVYPAGIYSRICYRNFY